MTSHQTHMEQQLAARVIEQPCMAAHVTFGGGCLNCGYDPTARSIFHDAENATLRREREYTSR